MANNRRPIKFMSPDVGFVIFLGQGGWDFRPRDAGAVWRSTDAGMSWSKVPDGRYTALATVPQAFVIAAGLGGSFATSHDAGKTWHQVKLPINSDIVAIAAWDPGGESAGP